MVSKPHSGHLNESRASSGALSSSGPESAKSSSFSSKTSPRTNVPVRRGPVIVSSDEESEPEPIRPQTLRALSRTPSWAKSSVSPSSPPDTLRMVGFSSSVSGVDLGSDYVLRRRESGSARSRLFTERSDSQESSGTANPTVADLVTGGEDSRWGSVFGSDSEHGSGSGRSGRIRAESGKSWSWSRCQSVSSLLASGSGSEDDSESGQRGDDPQPGQSTPKRGSDEGFEGERHPKPRFPSCLDARTGSSIRSISPGLPPKIQDDPPEDGDEGTEAGSGDDPGERPDLNKISSRLGQLPPKRGFVAPSTSPSRKRRSGPKLSGHSDAESASLKEPTSNLSPQVPKSLPGSESDESSSEEWQSAASGIDQGSDAEANNNLNPSPPAVRVKKPRSERLHRPIYQVERVNPDYVKLFNEEICLAASRGVYGYEGSAESKGRQRSQMIIRSVWTNDEQTALFKHLSVVGKDNLSELARGVGTKSIVECRAFLKALQDGREDYNELSTLGQAQRGRDFISTRDISAAIELSDECVKALEENADYLERRAQEYEEKMEKTKWGDSWLLDLTTAEHIEYLYRNKRIKEIHDIAPEAELLNVDQMLDLSECIFMYGPEQSWKDLGEELPSIRHTALSDIHTLVVSLTRRIVQASLFMAMSRLRSMDDKVFNPRSSVRPSDVEAAIDSLGAPRKSNYWVKLPRKLGMKVYRKVEQIRLKSDKNAIPYDEVEDYLERERGREFGRSGSSLGLGKGTENSKVDMDALVASAYEESEHEEGAGDELSSVNDPMGIDDGGFGSNARDKDEGYHFVQEAGRIHQSRPQKKRDAMIAALEEEEDSYMEVLDRKQSLEAEKTLWQMMKKESRKPLPQNSISLPKEPIRKKKRGREVFDWRDDMNYLAPWETTKKRKTGHGDAEDGVMEEDQDEDEDGDEDEGEDGDEDEDEGDDEGGTDREDEEGEANLVPTNKRTLISAVLVLAPEKVTALQKTEAVPLKQIDTKKKSKQPAKPKKPHIPATSSPRKPRVRRQSKAFSGFVSTIENVAESDAEALAREKGDDDTSEEEERGDR